MTTDTQTKTRKQAEVGYETSTFVLGVGIVMAALVGLWGAACIASALIGSGPLNLLKSYFSALIG